MCKKSCKKEMQKRSAIYVIYYANNLGQGKCRTKCRRDNKMVLKGEESPSLGGGGGGLLWVGQHCSLATELWRRDII
jgi:hypothetical protein